MYFCTISKTGVRHMGRMASILIACSVVFSPLVPTIQLPIADAPFELGLEVARTLAYGNGYSYRRSITINESQVAGTSDHTNFPVLMSFTEAELRTTGNGGNVTDAQGDDIIFTSDANGSSVLDFELERYNASTGEVTAWVEIPTLDYNDNTVVYLFYGNPNITSTQEDVAGTWDANYVGVWHMDGDGSTQLDSADGSVSHDATVSGATAGANGKIGPAYDFDGTNDTLTVSDESELDLTNSGTFEAWVRTDDVTTWETINRDWRTTTNFPNGAGGSMFSGVDSVIVGDTWYHAGMLCTGTTETFSTASNAIGGGAFSTWTSRTATGTAAATGGCQIAMDSDGKELWHATMSVNGTNAYVAYATSTLTYSTLGAWQPLGSLGTLAGLTDGSAIDMVITGNKAYFAVLALNGTTEAFRVGSVNLDGSGWTGWTTLATTNLAGGDAESCSVSINTDGVKLYYSAHCHNGTTSTFGRASSAFDFSSYVVWTNDTDPAVGQAGASDFNFVDSTLIGGHSYHAFYGHEGTVERYNIASSSPEGGSVSTWVSMQNTTTVLPGGAGAVETSDPSIESDGKTLYYTAFGHDATTEAYYIASTTLAAHPFLSKYNAYELMQTGKGYVFDWAGKPSTFGTTTGTTNFEHVVLTHDGTRMSYYINGQLMGSTTVNTDFWSNSNDLIIGGGHRATSTPIYFDGIVDEVRVSSSARSAEWIQTQYNNQNATSTFYTLGAQESDSSAPTVTTNFASNVGASSARLHGNITSTGGETGGSTEHGFAYSTNATLSSGVSTTTLGTYAAAGTFSEAIASLSPNTTYYYRSYATNSAGTGYGAIQSFFTGNANVSRNLRLFEGSTVKLLNGTLKLNQQ